MTTERQRTREEKSYGRVLEENRRLLSGAANALLETAESAAYRANLAPRYAFQPEEYQEATQKTRTFAAEITDRERALLAKIARAALAAAASIDPGEERTHLGDRIYLGDLYSYYKMVCGMVEDVLI